MSAEDKDLAKEHRERAARQAKHAVRNVGEAAEHEKDAIVDSIDEKIAPASTQGVMTLMGYLGSGIFATVVAGVSANIAVQKYRDAYSVYQKMRYPKS